MIDALACEPHFLDHLAPIWNALPEQVRGTFTVDASLTDRAVAAGIEPVARDAEEIRRSSPPPAAKPGDGPIALAASIGDIKVGRRLGYRQFVFVEHGIGQAYGPPNGNANLASYAGGPDRQDVVLNIVPNETCAANWRRSYPKTPVAVVGCAKLDSLPVREDGPWPVVAISFHWTPALSVSGYAQNAFGEFGPALPALAKRYKVIGHAHPRAKEFVWRDYGRAGIEVVRDFADVCRRADVYVCDNSSTIYEFAATGRPVVVMNAKLWTRRANYGLRFWDAAEVGLNVSDPDDLPAAIDRALELRPEDVAAREAALDIVYAFRSGAADRAAEAIVDLVA